MRDQLECWENSISPNPYAMAVCPECFDEWSKMQKPVAKDGDLAKDEAKDNKDGDRVTDDPQGIT